VKTSIAGTTPVCKDLRVSRETGWDYLIVTASNDLQARAYEAQMRLRQNLGLLQQVRRALVVPDREGKRIGSGGATVGAIARVLEIERERGAEAPEQILRNLRAMIVHAGGDSMRLPAYGPCGKIFVPLPGPCHGPLPPALFDRLVPALLDLPGGEPGHGQIVVAAGDALMHWDISGLQFGHRGITMLGCRATPEDASRHGVFCIGEDSSMSRYLQKPSRAELERAGAVGPAGEAVLDIAVMSMDAAAAAVLLRVLGDGDAAAVREWVAHGGLDLYREICCALGSSATFEHYLASARAGGSTWPEGKLARLYPGIHGIPSHAHVLPYCRFLHFGSTRQLAPSGLAVLEQDRESLPADSLVLVNNVITKAGSAAGSGSWVEGCRISAPLELAGNNVVVGVDVDAPLSLPPEACLEVVAGRDRWGKAVWFARIYGVRDTFKDSVTQGGLFCGQPLLEWISTVGADSSEVWRDTANSSQRTLWNARVFPAEATPGGFRRWLWMYQPGKATSEEKREFIAADRYSAAEIALLTDQRAFHFRRLENWAREPDPAKASGTVRVLAEADSCFDA
jgi:fucokinase